MITGVDPPAQSSAQVSVRISTPDLGPGVVKGVLGQEPRSATSTPLRRLIKGRLTLDDVWLLLPLLVILLMSNQLSIYPNDFWWHLRIGQIIAQTRAIPAFDLFTFSRAGFPWTNQSWLVQLVFYFLYHVGSLPLVIFASSVTITIGYAFLEAACYLAGGRQPRVAAVGIFAAAAVGLVFWGIRPQLASFALFGALVCLVEAHRQGNEKAVWAMPLLFALWVNAHGGFVFGASLLFIYCLTRVVDDAWHHRSLQGSTRRLLIAALVSAFALGLNPSGPLGIVRYVLGFFQSSTTLNANIEFQPLTIRSLQGALFIAATLALLAVAYGKRRRLSVYHMVAFGAFGLFALYSQRVVPWYGMIIGPALAGVLGRLPGSLEAGRDTRRSGSPRLNYAILGLACLVTVVTLPWLRPLLPVPSAQRAYVDLVATPTTAAERLCRLGPAARPFSDIGYSSYLEWACPSQRVFMDTRFELYPTEMWDDYILTMNGQYGWEDVMTKYDLTAILASKKIEKVLVKAVKASPSWSLLYEDENTALFQRIGASGTP